MKVVMNIDDFLTRKFSIECNGMELLMLYNDLGKSSGSMCAEELVDEDIKLNPDIAEDAHVKMYDILCDVLKDNNITK